MNISVNKSDITWSYIGVVASIGSNLIVVPLVMYFLSGDMLGIWYIFMSIGGIASLFDFGFSPTFARNIAYCWSGVNSLKKQNFDEVASGDPNYDLLKRVLLTSKLIYALLSIGLLILLLSVGTIYITVITKDVEGRMHLIAWFLFIGGTFLNLYYNYYDTFLRGVGAVTQANKCRVIAKLVQMGVILILLCSGCGILGVTLGYIAYGFAFRFFANYYFYKYNNIGAKLNAIKVDNSFQQSKELFKIVWYSAWREGAVQFCLYCGEQLSVIIGSFYLTLEETGYYSLGLQIASALATIAATSYTTYQPTLQNAFVIKDVDKIRHTMSTIITSLLALMAIGFIAMIFIGIPLLNIIKPEAVISLPIFCGIYANQFVLKLRNCYSSYFSCSNRLIYIKSFVTSAILCIVLSFILCEFTNLGVWALIIAQLGSQLLYNAWYWPTTGNREMRMNFLSLINLGYVDFKKKYIHG